MLTFDQIIEKAKNNRDEIVTGFYEKIKEQHREYSYYNVIVALDNNLIVFYPDNEVDNAYYSGLSLKLFTIHIEESHEYYTQEKIYEIFDEEIKAIKNKINRSEVQEPLSDSGNDSDSTSISELESEVHEKSELEGNNNKKYKPMEKLANQLSKFLGKGVEVYITKENADSHHNIAYRVRINADLLFFEYRVAEGQVYIRNAYDYVPNPWNSFLSIDIVEQELKVAKMLQSHITFYPIKEEMLDEYFYSE
jgi:hypothetical protein